MRASEYAGIASKDVYRRWQTACSPVVDFIDARNLTESPGPAESRRLVDRDLHFLYCFGTTFVSSKILSGYRDCLYLAGRFNEFEVAQEAKLAAVWLQNFSGEALPGQLPPIQHLPSTSDAPPKTSETSKFALEQKWIKANRERFAGKWVALSGDMLIAAADKAKEVYSEARRQGYKSPRVVLIEGSDGPPFGGW